MNESCADRDLVKRGRTMWLVWGLPVAITLVTRFFVGSGWIVMVSWTLALIVMGVAGTP